MKNTVFTVITAVLLLATLCLPAAAQTWELEDWYAGPDDDRPGDGIVDIEFRDNHQVFFGKGDRLYKWDLTANWLWWLDFGGDAVSHVEVPRRYSGVVIHASSENGWLSIRDTDDLSVKAQKNLGSRTTVLDLSVDDYANYLILQRYTRYTRDFDAWKPYRYYGTVYDLWGSNGWQFSYKEGSLGRTSPITHLMMHPTHSDNDGALRFFLQYQPSERFYEYSDYWADRHRTDTFITTRWDNIDDIAARPTGNFRLAALDSGNVIHIWDWAGNHLFTFNESENYGPLYNLEFTPNGELLVTRGPRWVTFWDMSQQAEDHSFWINALQDNERIYSLAFSDNGKLMAIGGSDGTVYIYKWTGGSAPTAPAKEVEPAQPTALLSNYPNPFNPETWIPYQLSEAAEVTVTIHASDGKLVRTLELGQVPAGVYSEKDRAAYWDGQNEQGEPVASGVYFYTLTAGEFKATRKMVIRK